MLTKELLESLERVVGEMNKLGAENGKSYRVVACASSVIINQSPIGQKNEFRQVAYVSLNAFDCYGVTITNDMNKPWKYVMELSWLLERYAKTPIEDREEKCYYVKVADGSFGYLNYRDGDYGVFEKDNELRKTKFTRSEIAKYLGTDDDKLLDMYIERFCEEVE